MNRNTITDNLGDRVRERLALCDRDVIIYSLAKIVKPEAVKIGDGTRMDDFTFIFGGQGTELRRHNHMASFVSVIGAGRLISVSNINCLPMRKRIAKLIGWPFTLRPDKHLCRFSQHTLRAMSSGTGFKVIEETVMDCPVLQVKLSSLVKSGAFALTQLVFRSTGVSMGGILESIS